jgi:hypothetical protein
MLAVVIDNARSNSSILFHAAIFCSVNWNYWVNIS